MFPWKQTRSAVRAVQKMAAADLVQLIDLSLGTEPRGVVNFNYLHGLLHEIVKRLVTLESLPVALHPAAGPTPHYEPGGEPAKDGVGITEGGGERGGLAQGEAGVGGKDGAGSGGKDGANLKERGGGEEGSPEHGKKIPSERELSLDSDRGRSLSPTERQYSSASGGGSTKRVTSGYAVQSRASLVSAANDLGALERKLQDLEMRVNTMETLPEMLERKSSDSGATPVADMWNFTNLSKRLGATEESLEKTSRLVDDILGELQSLRKQVNSFEDMKDLKEKVEGLKLAAAQDSMGEAAATMLAELKSETDKMKKVLGAVDPDAINSALQQHEELLKQHSASLESQSESLAKTEKGLSETLSTVSQLDGKVGEMSAQLSEFMEKVKVLEDSLGSKVNVDDLASLMPQAGGGDDEAATASLMSKLIEIQNRLGQIEGQVGGVPSDVADQIASMQKAIDALSAEVSSISSVVGSGSEDRSRLEELGLHVAQSRERMAELDRAVTAIGNKLSSTSREGPQPEEEPDGAKYVDMDSFDALQGLLSQLQQEHERLMGTAAHLSHELEINKEHVKSLYSGVDDLRDTKVDKDLLEVEVREKADRSALESKASREWVDSTFERLDREIREARSKLMGQEEALKSAMTQINEDVEGKLDRLELAPLKEYFDKRLDRLKPAPAAIPTSEAMVDDAAGFKKPLRFRCISCDKPVAIKPHTVVPSLPAIDVFPGTRSFRPYTTYELEMIRRHQRMGYPISGSLMAALPRSIRSAGGSHTRTRPHQRIRVAPLGSPYTPEPPPTQSTSIRSSPTVHDEVDIVGQDGHIYKGRMGRSRLPPLAQVKNGRPGIRPSTSPMGTSNL